MQATRTAAAMTRHALGAILEAVLIVALIVGLAFAVALATGHVPSGAHSALAASRGYSPSLDVSFASGSLAAAQDASTSTPYTIWGCQYRAAFGGVKVTVQSPVSFAWTGADVDSAGCISVTNFYTLGSGHYSIKAYQAIKGKNVLVASTSFDM